MQYVRAEPYRQDGGDAGASGAGGGGGGARAKELSAEGARSAVDSFKLLGLLLRPASRRKLQLLLKFMKRVSGNDQLTLRRDTNNCVLVLDMFVRIIIRYVDLYGFVARAYVDGDASYVDAVVRNVSAKFGRTAVYCVEFCTRFFCCPITATRLGILPDWNFRNFHRNSAVFSGPVTVILCTYWVYVIGQKYRQRITTVI